MKQCAKMSDQALFVSVLELSGALNTPIKSLECSKAVDIHSFLVAVNGSEAKPSTDWTTWLALTQRKHSAARKVGLAFAFCFNVLVAIDRSETESSADWAMWLAFADRFETSLNPSVL